MDWLRRWASLALRPSPALCEWSHGESHPDLRNAIASSCCWTMAPVPKWTRALGTCRNGLIHFPFGGKTPFAAEVRFVNRTVKRDRRTAAAIMYSEYGASDTGLHFQQ